MDGYRLGAPLGVGSAGEVVLARDEAIGRDVAIKRMRADTPSARAIDRFLREAKIQARLEHPAVVPVHALGVDARGLPCFAMKRIAGKTLAESLGLPRDRLLRRFAEVARAVDFAHVQGVVHRDLKPANVALGDFGEVYVLDWGVARVLGLPDLEVDGLVGTAGYMAPEQIATPSDVGGAADVYALGAMLFEILTGERLHPADRDQALASTTNGFVVSPSEVKPDRAIPPELDELCLSALARDPARRPSAHELADALEAYLDDVPEHAPRRSRAVIVLAVVCAVLALLLLAAAYRLHDGG